MTMRDTLKDGYRRFWFCTLVTLACMLFPYVVGFWLTSLADWWWLGFAAMLVFVIVGPWIFGFARLKCHWCEFKFRGSFLAYAASAKKSDEWKVCPHCGESLDREIQA